MDKINLDSLNNEIIRLLTENGRMPIGEMKKKLDVTSPTIRNRIKELEKNGLFKVAGLVDPNQHPQIVTALVAMSIRSLGKMDQILEKISRLPNVVWAGVCTGRYDIIAEVICVRGRDELYQFTTQAILKIGNVVRSETFIFLKSSQNWLCLPKGLEDI